MHNERPGKTSFLQAMQPLDSGFVWSGCGAVLLLVAKS